MSTDHHNRSEQGWTLDTLKEHLEQRIKQHEELNRKDLLAFNSYMAERKEALDLQAREYERRLDGLNGEQSRIAKSQETYVSREMWESIQREDRAWKTKADAEIGKCLQVSQFYAYKEATDKALLLKAGQSEGVGMTTGFILNVVSSLASVSAIIAVVIMYFRH